MLTHESGHLNLGARFVSLRLIKEALEKQNNISVLEETTTFLKCRVFRIARLFGAPYMGPYPTACFKIERSNQETIIHYDFYWPEFYLVAIGSFVLGVATYLYDNEANTILRIKSGLLIFITCLTITGFTTFLDVKYFSRKVRKSLKEI